MAVELHSGDFRYSIALWQPVETQNEEGGMERSFSLAFTTLAAIRSINTRRLNEAAAVALLHSQDFFIRYVESRPFPSTGWQIIYNGKTYTISESLRVNQKSEGDEWGRFIRLTAASKD